MPKVTVEEVYANAYIRESVEIIVSNTVRKYPMAETYADDIRQQLLIAFNNASANFDPLLGTLETYMRRVRDRRGMMAILIAHAKVERFEDPENTAYDRYTPRLHKHAASLLVEWCDAVLFANKKFRVQKENNRAIAAPVGADGGERTLRTVGSPACIAKNRYNLPPEMPLAFQAFLDGFGGKAHE